MRNLIYLQKMFFLLVIGCSLCTVQACGEDEERIIEEPPTENEGTLPSDSIPNEDDAPADSTTVPTDSTVTDNGIEAVDLGLSVKWAPCNVGASNINLHGSYFAWGEIAEKPEYNYDNSVTYGKGFNNISGDKLYDAARANWGGEWRMPTRDEVQELVENCNWTWTSKGVFEGYLVTSYTTGQSIFLPAAGYRDGASLIGAGTNFCYWTSSPKEGEDSTYSYSFHLERNEYSSHNRALAYCVRPVKGEIVKAGLPNFTYGGVGVYDLSNTVVTLSASLYDDGGARITECGFCISSTSEEPTIDDRKIVSNSTAFRNFYATFDNLDPGATYYARAYIVNSKGMHYSDAFSFTTLSSYYPHEAVDLGLSVKWATCNVGATSPEKYGGYYSWGETDEYDGKYSNSLNYKYESKYDPEKLLPEDDVATVKWGKKWRMPSQWEIAELINECTWAWTTKNGIKGQQVIGPNGNSIFLPAAGYYSLNQIYGRGSYSYYWSSSIYYDGFNSSGYYEYDTYSLRFDKSDQEIYDWMSKSDGLTVRPVCD